MIEFDVDFDIEKLVQQLKKYDNVFLPAVARDYNNRLAFNTRKISKSHILTRTTPRTGSARFITGGRVLSVDKARWSKDVEKIRAQVGGRVVKKARDPDFMARLEHGGTIPSDRFGQTSIPTLKGARRGNVAGNITRASTVPVLAAQAVSAKNVSGSERKKRAVAMGTALKARKRIVKMKDTKGRPSIYRVTGRGRGRNRKISQVTKLHTLSPRSHSSTGIHWLRDAINKSTSQRVKVFKRVAEHHKNRTFKRK